MRTTAELQRDAWEALVDRLGLAEAVRYRVVTESGTGDYARERERLFADTSLDDWLHLCRATDGAAGGHR